MNESEAKHEHVKHTHGSGARLSEAAAGVLSRGLHELLEITRGLAAFRAMPSERYPDPLRRLVCGEECHVGGSAANHVGPQARRGEPAAVRARVAARRASEPVSVLEDALVLAELYESHQPDSAELFAKDMKFVGQVFGSKRANGWCHILGGDAEARASIQKRIAARWQFVFFPVPDPYRPTGIYTLLERLVRYAFVYGYDDMSNIHHSKLHRDINSFLALEKGECIDPVRGEWTGINARAREMTDGRTTRIELHALGETPTTGCGCFGLILFKTDRPRPGIGIMHRGWAGRTPDGRTWADLHYALGGKQASGLSGCTWQYLKSPCFLQGERGWANVVWVTAKVAESMGELLPEGIAVCGQPGTERD